MFGTDIEEEFLNSIRNKEKRIIELFKETEDLKEKIRILEKQIRFETGNLNVSDAKEKYRNEANLILMEGKNETQTNIS